MPCTKNTDENFQTVWQLTQFHSDAGLERVRLGGSDLILLSGREKKKERCKHPKTGIHEKPPSSRAEAAAAAATATETPMSRMNQRINIDATNSRRMESVIELLNRQLLITNSQHLSIKSTLTIFFIDNILYTYKIIQMRTHIKLYIIYKCVIFLLNFLTFLSFALIFQISTYDIFTFCCSYFEPCHDRAMFRTFFSIYGHQPTHL